MTPSLTPDDNAAAARDQDMSEYADTAHEVFAEKAPEQDLTGLGQSFLAEFLQAELLRRPTERRWLQDLRQYKGKYDPEEETAIGDLRSKSFVRKTRVKVKTVDSRVADLLFPAGNDKNWEISPTPVPNVSDAQRAKVIADMVAMARQQLAAQAQQAQQAFDVNAPMEPPPKDAVDAVILQQVKKASKGMSKVIDDQLVESRYKQCAIQVLHSGHLYGTGVLKGPLVERRVRTRFQQTGESWLAKEESYLVPFVESVPLWRWYPDMGATELSQCRFVFERHTFTRAAFFALTSNTSFKKDKIIAHLKANPRGLVQLREFDQELKQIGERVGDLSTPGLYEVLERWGFIDGATLVGLGVTVPEHRMEEAFFANVWVLPNGQVIKAVLQPINGVTWPYHVYYFDKDETSIFGEGLASIMRDDQKMLNAATRLQIDNAAITSGPMIEVDVTLLSNADDATDIQPWKTFLRNGKQAGSPAVRPIIIPNHGEWLGNMARQFDQNADEVTAIPRYMAGENVSSGAAGTASGMSMLMGAVNIVIKDLITGYDEGITTPFLQALYRWNMQFAKDPAIKGDFDVYARGTASLVAKEVRARQLNEFAQLTANELDIPFVKRHKLNQLRAEALEMSDVIKTEDEVAGETNNDAAAQQQAAAAEMQKLLLAEQQAKTGRLMAETELAKAKVQQLVSTLELNIAQMKADAAQTAAQTDLIIAQAVDKKVASVFAALQAGGTATMNPTTAPAGDEILKSAGWVDMTPERSIGQLNGPPIQAQSGMVLPPDPVQPPAAMPPGMDAMPPEMAPQEPGDAEAQESAAMEGQETPAEQQAEPMEAQVPPMDQALPETGHVGLNAGMQTDELEGRAL
jgi:hypothetical protein